MLLEPGFDLFAQFLNAGDATIKALARQDIESDLGHVEPTAMFGGVVDIEFVGDALGLLGHKDFVEGRPLVRANLDNS